MEEKEFRRTDGSCVISEEVISSIASAAAVEVPGVAGMAQRPADIRGIIGSAAARAVRVLNNDSETVLDVYINLKQGARIPDVAGEVQRSVKVAVQSMSWASVWKTIRRNHSIGDRKRRALRRSAEGFFPCQANLYIGDRENGREIAERLDADDAA